MIAVVLLTASPISAQVLWIGGGVARDVQRFTENVVPDRLDGASTGWRAGATLVVRRHIALAGDWSDSGTIEDAQTLLLDVNGVSVPITSTFTHRTRSFSALAGYCHQLSARARAAYLFGAAVVNVRRQFLSDAAAAVLVSPSTPATSSPPVDDRLVAPSGGVEVYLRIVNGLYVSGGVRLTMLRLEPDLRGWSATPFIGAGWAF